MNKNQLNGNQTLQSSVQPIRLAAALLLLTGAAQADVPRVATDIAPVHGLVSRVMAGVGTPDLVVSPGASPHSHQLRPSQAAALQNADLVFWTGADLTPWMTDALGTLAGEASVVGLLADPGTERLKFREGALFEGHDHGGDEAEHAEHDHDHHHDHEEKAEHDGHDHDDHDHDDHGHKKDGHDKEEHAHGDHGENDHGHAHGEYDPHAWLSLTNAAHWTGLIAAELARLDPDNAATYRANAAAAQNEIGVLRSEIETLLAPVREGRFIVFHDAYQYFENDFDLSAVGAISLGDASDPSPARIAEIRARVSEERVDCVLAEPQFNAGLVTIVAEGTSAKIGIMDPLGTEIEPGAEFYPALMRALAQSLAACL